MENVLQQKISGIVSRNLRHYIIRNESDIKRMYGEYPIFDCQLLKDVIELYGYPITIILELQYIDKMYRDAYYVYYSHLHFDISRNCQRLALFEGEIDFTDFFDNALYEKLEAAILGTIVIRPSYTSETKYTFGRTLLDPSKMREKRSYIRTAKYKVIVCGHKYKIRAFPFSNQLGDALRCAETSVWALLEYYGTRYEIYKTILPSTILHWESEELVERALPSEGMTYSQISGLLKTFGFEPVVYVREIYKAEEMLRQDTDVPELISKDSPVPKPDSEYVDHYLMKAEEDAFNTDFHLLERYRAEHSNINKKNREIPMHLLFHYYVESGIPLITAVCNERNGINHSIVVIGHYERSPYRVSESSITNNSFEIEGLHCIDSSSLYERYITIDDNQYPYRIERYDHFSVTQNCKVKAFIVPLYRHILLRAEAAVNIVESYIREFHHIIQDTLGLLKEVKPGTRDNSQENPLVFRYYLTSSRGFTDFRNRYTDYIEEKLFYTDTPYPKFIWVGEISTLELYQENLAFGEVVVDATAPIYSGSGAVISVRMGGNCAYRSTEDKPVAIRERLLSGKGLQATFLFNLYTNNLQKGDF